MRFEIDFNRKDKNDNKEFYHFIGAELRYNSESSFCSYMIELESFEDLEKLLKKINLRCFGVDFGYSAVISFDPSTIYLDDKV